MKTPSIDAYNEIQIRHKKAMQDELNTFLSIHGQELEDEEKAVQLEKFSTKIPEFESQGLVVWCRNGSVCSEATPCKILECPYKKSKEDMINGMLACRNFQICVRPEFGGESYDSNLERMYR